MDTSDYIMKVIITRLKQIERIFEYLLALN